MNKRTLFIIGILLALKPSITLAQTNEVAQTALGSASNFGEFIALIWNFGSQTLLAFAVFFIILGSIFYIGSAGNEGKIEQGKQMIIGSLISVVIVILSGVLIRTLHKPSQGSTNQLSDIPNVIENASNLLLSFIGVFTVIMFAYAGIMTIMANGEADKVNKANRALKYAIFGLLIGISSYGIVKMIIQYFI